jgi:hypothetical protein
MAKNAATTKTASKPASVEMVQEDDTADEKKKLLEANGEMEQNGGGLKNGKCIERETTEIEAAANPAGVVVVCRKRPLVDVADDSEDNTDASGGEVKEQTAKSPLHKRKRLEQPAAATESPSFFGEASAAGSGFTSIYDEKNIRFRA